MQYHEHKANTWLVTEDQLFDLLSLAELSAVEYGFWGHESELGADGAPPVIQKHGSLREAIAREPERAREEVANMFGLDYYRVLADDEEFEISGRQVGQKRKRGSVSNVLLSGPATKKHIGTVSTGTFLPTRESETAGSAPDSMYADEDDERQDTPSDRDDDVALQRPDGQRSVREDVSTVHSSSRSPKIDAASSRALRKEAAELRGQAPSSTTSGKRAGGGKPEQSRNTSGSWKGTVRGGQV
jgi:hypothetical protein